MLVVEDDRDLQDLIRIAGESRGYRMITSGNGIEAKKEFENGRMPSVIILDINMPGMDGFSFCRWLRDEHPVIPVIFLSARSDEYDKVLALEIGGDDYLTKPFSMKELFARTAVCLRRVGLFSEGKTPDHSVSLLVLGGITIYPERWMCEYKGEDVILTVSEFRILSKFASRPGDVLSRDILAKAAFPEDVYNSGRSVDVHICRLRQKLQKIDAAFDSIETVYQVGYRWKS